MTPTEIRLAIAKHLHMDAVLHVRKALEGATSAAELAQVDELLAKFTHDQANLCMAIQDRRMQLESEPTAAPWPTAVPVSQDLLDTAAKDQGPTTKDQHP